ncbi:hypothetical protein ACHAL6_12385 [Proteiniclasticum sp. C24MP]|uniref:hypothetical protein n=1 Tax=Proteiniclasticum sp. C24MP TaxID=3374101 RepID=UPI00375469F5
MNSDTLLYLLVIGLIAVIAAGAFIADVVRKKDYKDQVSGKKPERKINSKKKISYDKPVEEDVQITIDREVLRTRSGQNVLGPK